MYVLLCGLLIWSFGIIRNDPIQTDLKCTYKSAVLPIKTEPNSTDNHTGNYFFFTSSSYFCVICCWYSHLNKPVGLNAYIERWITVIKWLNFGFTNSEFSYFLTTLYIPKHIGIFCILSRFEVNTDARTFSNGNEWMNAAASATVAVADNL